MQSKEPFSKPKANEICEYLLQYCRSGLRRLDPSFISNTVKFSMTWLLTSFFFLFFFLFWTNLLKFLPNLSCDMTLLIWAGATYDVSFSFDVISYCIRRDFVVNWFCLYRSISLLKSILSIHFISAAILPVVQKQHQLLVTLLLCNACASEVSIYGETIFPEFQIINFSCSIQNLFVAGPAYILG